MRRWAGRPPRAHDLRHTFAVKTLLGWYRAGVDVAARTPLLSTYLGHSDPVATYWYLSASPSFWASQHNASNTPAKDAHPTAGPCQPHGPEGDRAELARRTRPSRRSDECAGAHAAGILHRPADQPDETPARTPSPPIATPSDCSDLHPGSRPASSRRRSISKPSTRPGSPRFSTTSNASVATGRAPSTPGSRRSIPYSDSPPCDTPSTPNLIARVLAIPAKRFDRAIVTYLTRGGRRAARRTRPQQLDRPPRPRTLTLAIQTGLRVSELTALRRQDVHLRTGAHVRTNGKGRKLRATPLTTQTAAVLRSWLQELDDYPAGPVFPTTRGRPLSRDAVALLVAKHTCGCQPFVPVA